MGLPDDWDDIPVVHCRGLTWKAKGYTGVGKLGASIDLATLLSIAWYTTAISSGTPEPGIRSAALT